MNLINIMNLWKDEGKDIFDEIYLDPRLDKDLVVNTILDYSATYIPLYQDYNLFNFKNKVFFDRNRDNIVHLLDAFTLDYDPIYNYDRYEKYNEVDETKRNSNSTSSLNSNRNSTSSLNSNIENRVSAYNSSTYQPSNESLSADSTKENVTSDDSTKENVTSDDKHNYYTDNRIYGNIGVTTTQQMLESEIDLRDRYNIYEWIARKWYNEFMLKVEEVI